MGSWSGHTLPGSLFICFGLVWAIKHCYRYFYAHISQTSRRRRCRVKWDIIESGILIFCALFGLCIEQMLPWEPWFHVTSRDTDEFTQANNWSHSTMYSFFIVFGIVQILVIKMPRVMPHCLHHITLALAFFIEGYLFYFHTHGREELDVRVHVLLLFAIWPTSLILLILAFTDKNENIANAYKIRPPVMLHEIPTQNGTDSTTSLLSKDDDLEHEDAPTLHVPDDTEAIPLHENHCNGWGGFKNVEKYKSKGIEKFRQEMAIRKKIFTMQISVATLTLLHGMWFWEAAYVLYPPNGKPWDEENHKNIAFLTMFFTWYLLLSMTIVGVIFLLFAVSSHRRQKDRNYVSLQNTEVP